MTVDSPEDGYSPETVDHPFEWVNANLPTENGFASASTLLQTERELVEYGVPRSEARDRLGLGSLHSE